MDASLPSVLQIFPMDASSGPSRRDQKQPKNPTSAIAIKWRSDTNERNVLLDFWRLRYLLGKVHVNHFPEFYIWDVWCIVVPLALSLRDVRTEGVWQLSQVASPDPICSHPPRDTARRRKKKNMGNLRKIEKVDEEE